MELHSSLLVFGSQCFVLKPNNDVYEEVVKPLLEKSKPNLEPVFLLDLSQIHHLRKELKLISIVSKLTLVIIDCLFHGFPSSHVSLMF